MTVLLSIMPASHTKFSCDQVLRYFQKLSRKTKCSNLADIADTIEKSTITSRKNFPVISTDLDGNEIVLVLD